MERWELAARESCRDTLARYTHCGDRFLIDEMVGTFTEAGVLEVHGTPPVAGRAAIAEFLRGVPLRDSGRDAPAAPTAGVGRFIRHHVSSIRFESVTPEQIGVASYFAVITEIGLDHCGRYRDRLVPTDGQWLFAHRLVRTDWMAAGSRFA